MCACKCVPVIQRLNRAGALHQDLQCHKRVQIQLPLSLVALDQDLQCHLRAYMYACDLDSEWVADGGRGAFIKT